MRARTRAWLAWTAATAVAWSTLPLLDAVEGLAIHQLLNRPAPSWELSAPTVGYEDGALVVWYHRLRPGAWELWRSERGLLGWRRELLASAEAATITGREAVPVVLTATGALVAKHDGLFHCALETRTLAPIVPLVGPSELVAAPDGSVFLANAVGRFTHHVRGGPGAWSVTEIVTAEPLPLVWAPHRQPPQAEAVPAADTGPPRVAYPIGGGRVAVVGRDGADEPWHLIEEPHLPGAGALVFRGGRLSALFGRDPVEWGDGGARRTLIAGWAIASARVATREQVVAIGFGATDPAGNPHVGLLAIDGEAARPPRILASIGTDSPDIGSVALSADGSRTAFASLEGWWGRAPWIEVYESTAGGLSRRGAAAGLSPSALRFFASGQPLREPADRAPTNPLLVLWMTAVLAIQWLAIRRSGAELRRWLLIALPCWLLGRLIAGALLRQVAPGPYPTTLRTVILPLLASTIVGLVLGLGQWLGARPALSPRAPLLVALGCFAATSTTLVLRDTPFSWAGLVLWFGRGLTMGIVLGAASGLALRGAGEEQEPDL